MEVQNTDAIQNHHHCSHKPYQGQSQQYWIPGFPVSLEDQQPPLISPLVSKCVSTTPFGSHAANFGRYQVLVLRTRCNIVQNIIESLENNCILKVQLIASDRCYTNQIPDILTALARVLNAIHIYNRAHSRIVGRHDCI